MLIRRRLFLETAFDGLFGSSNANYVPLLKKMICFFHEK